jgi:hypothetical protein
VEAIKKSLSPLIMDVLVQWPEAFIGKLVRGVIVELGFKFRPERLGQSRFAALDVPFKRMMRPAITLSVH